MPENQLGLDDEFMATMLGDFLDESVGYLSRLNENLLVLDDLIRSLADPSELSIDIELLNEMFRDAHSLKGLSAMLQLDNINVLTHLVENVFDAARQGSLSVSREATDLMFEAVDCLSSMVDQLREGTGEQPDSKSISDRITAFLEKDGLTRDALSREQLSEILTDVSDEIVGTNESEPLHQPDSGQSEQAPPEVEVDPFAEVVDESEIQPKYLAIFLDESNESLDELTDHLISSDSCEVAPLLVICHRIKGAAAAIGLNRAARLAHFMEDILQDHLNNNKTLSQIMANAVLSAADSIRHHLANLANDTCGEDEFVAAYRQLQSASSELQSESDPSGAAAIEAESLVDILEEVCEQSHETGSPNADHSGQETASQTTVPPNATESPSKSDAPQPNSSPPKVANASTQRTANPKSGSKTTSSIAEKPAETVRVDIERLDQLMNLAGQLVINKARFGQLGDKLKDACSYKQSQQSLQNISTTLSRLASDGAPLTKNGGESTLARSLASAIQQIERDLEVVKIDLDRLKDSRTQVNELNEAVHQLDRIADGIQKSVMNTRMVPIGPLFGRFKRVIRDIARGNGRDIQLIIRGEKTELDKRMIDELSDPLIHMVRNSADHGIEPPEQREKAGKPKTGSIELDAYHRGNRIVIEVKDDGKGLDPEKIKAKAIANGIISAQDSERLSDEQAYQLIWEPGFSTAEQVTEVSGRGMGMDIVRSRIEQLSGTVELQSVPGQGTTIAIKLPLTMAILPSLLTEISGDAFAIPVESVIEIVRVEPKDLATVHNKPTARVRGRVISVVELGQLLAWNCPRPERTHTQRGCTLVIIGTDERELGLAVDDLLGEEDIVIKSLAENYKNVHGLAGASILGDGRVSLILDVGALIEISCKKQVTNEI